MTVLKLVTYPSAALKTKAKPVAEITPVIRQLIDDMFETMYATNGIGLAAPQVGVDLRIAVLDVPESPQEATPGFIQTGKFALINPVIEEAEGEIDWEEGCLSVPGFWTVMKRHQRLKLHYLDPQGKKESLKAENLLAVAIQQEIDHLDGKLIIDEVSRLKRDMYLQRVKKEKKHKE